MWPMEMLFMKDITLYKCFLLINPVGWRWYRNIDGVCTCAWLP